ncbi:MAG: DUF4139 domain-containing protein [Pseudomonadota bacterium]
MRKSILMATIAISPMAALADTFAVPMVPDAVTVFPQGAIIQSRTVVRATPGDHEIKFLIPPQGLQGTLPRFSVSGATVTGVSARRTLSEGVSVYYTEREQRLMDRQDTLADDQTDLSNRMTALSSHRAALVDQATFLKSIRPATDAPQSLDDLKAIADYLPTALQQNADDGAAVDLQIAQAQTEWTDLAGEINRLNAEIARAGLPNDAWWEVVLTTTQPDAGDIDIRMAAFAPDAGWSPFYEVRLDETQGQVHLDRRAQLRQNTGQGWSGVQVTLSSAQPFQRVDPVLPRRDVVDLMNESKAGGYAVSSRMAEPLAAPELMAADVVQNFSTTAGVFDGVAVTFDLANRQNIATGATQGQMIQLAPLTLDVDVDRFANARHDTNAFVRAQMRNTTGEPILSGQAEFYRDATLIGSRPMALIAAGAKTDLFFGPDQTLPITLKFLSEQSGDSGFFSQSNTRKEDISFQVENLGEAAQDVVVTYALPISVDEDLDVDLAFSTRPNRTDVDGEPGVAEWDITVPAGGQDAIGLTFQITWPEGSAIQWAP